MKAGVAVNLPIRCTAAPSTSPTHGLWSGRARQVGPNGSADVECIRTLRRFGGRRTIDRFTISDLEALLGALPDPVAGARCPKADSYAMILEHTRQRSRKRRNFDKDRNCIETPVSTDMMSPYDYADANMSQFHDIVSRERLRWASKTTQVRAETSDPDGPRRDGLPNTRWIG